MDTKDFLQRNGFPMVEDAEKQFKQLLEPAQFRSVVIYAEERNRLDGYVIQIEDKVFQIQDRFASERNEAKKGALRFMEGCNKEYLRALYSIQDSLENVFGKRFDTEVRPGSSLFNMDLHPAGVYAVGFRDHVELGHVKPRGDLYEFMSMFDGVHHMKRDDILCRMDISGACDDSTHPVPYAAVKDGIIKYAGFRSMPDQNFMHHCAHFNRPPSTDNMVEEKEFLLVPLRPSPP